MDLCAKDITILENEISGYISKIKLLIYIYISFLTLFKGTYVRSSRNTFYSLITVPPTLRKRKITAMAEKYSSKDRRKREKEKKRKENRVGRIQKD